MSFRPFSLGDALLLQRLRNYSTPLQIERILLESISPVRTALRSRFPWYRHSSFTYVLRQEENGLAREGLIQLRIRPHSHEADVTLLSPALDAPQGHPAIWQKLLTYSAQHIFRQNVCRLFSDLPDQPLLVNTFRQAGFVPLTQVTIWRLDSAPLAPSESTLRPQRAADAPELERLYQRITPVPVQRLEVGWPPISLTRTASRPSSPTRTTSTFPAMCWTMTAAAGSPAVSRSCGANAAPGSASGPTQTIPTRTMPASCWASPCSGSTKRLTSTAPTSACAPTRPASMPS